MKNAILFLSQLLRIKQWAKNSFIFFPLVFSGNLFQVSPVKNCLIAFAGFCFLSSGLYVFNDFLDRDRDRLHPQKSKRPLARAKISPSTIYLLIGSLIFAGLFICWVISPAIFFSGLIYIGLHLIYNFCTKKIVILDVVFVAFGFQIRIWAGSLASGVYPSVWLQMCVFLLALFLGFNKRRHELSSLGATASQHRSVLASYTDYLLDQIIIICSTLSIVFYGLYTISPEMLHRIGNNTMVYSVPFVIYGIFRYLYLIHIKKQGGDPGEILLTDSSSLVNVLLWILFIVFLLYPLK